MGPPVQGPWVGCRQAGCRWEWGGRHHLAQGAMSPGPLPRFGCRREKGCSTFSGHPSCPVAGLFLPMFLLPSWKDRMEVGAGAGLQGGTRGRPEHEAPATVLLGPAEFWDHLGTVVPKATWAPSPGLEANPVGILLSPWPADSRQGEELPPLPVCGSPAARTAPASPSPWPATGSAFGLPPALSLPKEPRTVWAGRGPPRPLRTESSPAQGY